MPSQHPRMARERKTVKAMIRLYCDAQHREPGSRSPLCLDCAELLGYALERLDGCPFQEGKTTCARCPVHCYRPEMRDQIRAVMRYAGPRMLFRHPVLAVLHLFDGIRARPARVRGR